MVSSSFLKKLQKLDAHAKTIDDFRVRTVTGGTVTLITGALISALVLFEIMRYITPVMNSEIVVDGGKMEKLPIAFDITFPHIPCYILSLDVMDESGDHITEYDHDVYKERLDKTGVSIEQEKSKDLSNKAVKDAMGVVEEGYCGSCYGAKPNKEGADQCCNTCQEVQRAYADMGWTADSESFEQCLREGWKEKTEAQSQEGCRMHGTLSVNKLRGNFHFSAGRAFNHRGQHIHDMSKFLHNNEGHNFMHHIEHLRFGSSEYMLQKQKRTRSDLIVNPLDNTKWGNLQAAVMYQYFIKIIPTEFDFLNGKKTRTFQYSISKHDQVAGYGGGGLPGVFFMLDHSPMRIVNSEYRPTLGSFLTSICSIIGGLFSVASIIDSVLYRAEKMRNQSGK
ncbi:endoplasmic reticulum vesicle transporter-domain-containing protein [Pilobolus umbonatus]|nr:endoplasmic reticulum vesicle transporter-domain-containing protein [Pilobolus umbonatus]